MFKMLKDTISTMEKRNIGRFTISEKLIRDEPNKVCEIFWNAKLVIVRAEMLFAQGSVEYTAFSPILPEVPEGCLIQLYKLQIIEDGEGNIIEVTTI